MTKYLIGLFPALLFVTPALSVEITQRPTTTEVPVTWVGIAASPMGRVFQGDFADNQEDAKQAAVDECNSATGESCSGAAVPATIATPANWDVTALRCGMQVFFGQSSREDARSLAYAAAAQAGFDRRSCDVVGEYQHGKLKETPPKPKPKPKPQRSSRDYSRAYAYVDREERYKVHHHHHSRRS